VNSRKASAVSRRAVLRSAAAASAATLATGAGANAGANAAPARARTADGKWTRLRRVVTGEDAAGKGFVLADGEPGNAFELNGTRIVRLWETTAVPTPLPLASDAGATAGNAYREGFRGTSFYVAELPGGARAPSIPMHRNTTLDYMAILSGRIVFKIDDREIELGAGDTLVQGGNMHTWINRWDEPCLLLFVVVSATAPGAAA
jgi:mannose-6-phosphate isomerase-like protein (cupin superfamily)